MCEQKRLHIGILALLLFLLLPGCQQPPASVEPLIEQNPDNSSHESVELSKNDYAFPEPGEIADEVLAHIAYYSGKPGAYELFIMDEEGDNVQNIGGTDVYEQFATWSPRGDKVAFIASDTASPYQNLFIKDLRSRKITQLTQNLGSVMAPVWSPDGTQLLFVVDAGQSRDIYHVQADGRNLMALTDTMGMDGAPSWSPDGTKFVFVSERDGNEEIYIMSTNGTDLVRLTTNEEAVDTAPAWSPDGSRIAFVSDRDGDFEIYVLNINEDNIIPLTDNPTAYDWSPV